MSSSLSSIQRLVEDIEKRISKFIMAKACAFLSVENNNVKRLIFNQESRKKEKCSKFVIG